MKLNEIIEAALTYLGDEEAGVGGHGAKHPKIQLLVKCANIVIKEIATEYLPLESEEKVALKNGVFGYDVLPYRAYRIIKITEGGNPVRFKQGLSECAVTGCGGGSVDVRYSYMPDDASLNDDCQIFPAVTIKTLALGVCAEYAMIEGMYEQSVMFGERFKDDMRTACRKRNEMVIKPRVWM